MTAPELQALQERIIVMHAVYCRLTGRELPLTMQNRFAWEAWCAKGWTEESLTMVIGYIKSLVRQNRRRPESFRIHNLLDLERFGEDLAECRAVTRNSRPPITPRQAALRAAGRPASDPINTAQSTAAILERARLAEMLAQWRKENL